MRDSVKDLKETLTDNMQEIEGNYKRALNEIIDLEDERDLVKEDKQEILRRLEWVLGADLNEMENTIYDIISEFKEKA